ncbi:hypothetical protein SBA4_3380006 [Candidatus Sulfopaludibacter sp. SbA4]|nr:hypothetical protein SBA4_3380006 [Candidatus Sulfopaludibacter sp. SbA4]
MNCRVIIAHEAEKILDRLDPPTKRRIRQRIVHGLTESERRLLESKLSLLREFLNDLSSDAEWNVQTACS